MVYLDGFFVVACDFCVKTLLSVIERRMDVEFLVCEVWFLLPVHSVMVAVFNVFLFEFSYSNLAPARRRFYSMISYMKTRKKCTRSNFSCLSVLCLS